MQGIERWSPERTISGWIEESGLSLRQIEAKTGVSRSKLALFKRDEGKLNVSDLMAICIVIGRNPRDIFERDLSIASVDGAYVEIGTKIGDALMDTVEDRQRQNGETLRIEDVIDWHERTAGHLYQSEEIRSHCMAVEPLDRVWKPLRVVDVGPKCLASRKIANGPSGVVKPRDVERFVETGIPGSSSEMLKRGYVDLLKNGGRQYLDRKLFHQAENGSVFFTVYFTILMLGYWHDGKEVVWNFSKEVSSRLATEAERVDLLGSMDPR